jgi:hypothetical protein
MQNTCHSPFPRTAGRCCGRGARTPATMTGLSQLRRLEHMWRRSRLADENLANHTGVCSSSWVAMPSRVGRRLRSIPPFPTHQTRTESSTLRRTSVRQDVLDSRLPDVRHVGVSLIIWVHPSELRCRQLAHVNQNHVLQLRHHDEGIGCCRDDPAQLGG